MHTYTTYTCVRDDARTKCLLLWHCGLRHAAVERLVGTNPFADLLVLAVTVLVPPHLEVVRFTFNQGDKKRKAEKQRIA